MRELAAETFGRKLGSNHEPVTFEQITRALPRCERRPSGLRTWTEGVALRPRASQRRKGRKAILFICAGFAHEAPDQSSFSS